MVSLFQSFFAELYLVIFIDGQDFHPDSLSHFENISDIPDSMMSDFRDVEETDDVGKDLNKASVFFEAYHLPRVNLSHFGFHSDFPDHLQGLFGRLNIRGSDGDLSALLDIYLGIGLSKDFFDVFSCRSDYITHFLGIDHQVDDPGSIGGDVRPGLRKSLFHFFQDFESSIFSLEKAFFEHLDRDERYLQVHLDSCDAFFCSRHLEVHIAEMVFQASDICEKQIAVTFMDKSNRNSR